MPSTQNNYEEAVQENIVDHMEKLQKDERRKRINLYKKVIIYTMAAVILLSIILWIAILFKMNQIDQRIDNISLTIVEDIWRTLG
ncbi:MAG: hypothetical protein HFI34_10785 [Lachnospiraceae bacterium]|nr:hypothetical protein [Lachnospiraceae bacterium]